MRFAIYALLLFAGLCFAQIQSVEFEISKGDSIVNLPHRFIIPQSEILKIDTLVLLPGIHYQINYNLGKVYLHNSVISKIDSSRFKFKAVYRTLPIDTIFFKYRRSELTE